jgi:hypothetical protein
MKRVYIILTILLNSFTSFGQKTEVNNLDFEALKAEYSRILSKKNEILTSAFIRIDTNSILNIIDSSFIKEFPLIDFYSLTIIDGTAFEYNFGRINIVIASEKLNSKNIRILFPFDFSHHSDKFLKIFVNRTYTIEKNEISNSISNIFLKVEHFNELCCDKTIEEIKFQNCFSDENTLNNVINFKLNCCQGWLPKPGEKKKKQENFRNTKFVFDNQKLLKIDLSGWKNWSKIKLCIE